METPNLQDLPKILKEIHRLKHLIRTTDNPVKRFMYDDYLEQELIKYLRTFKIPEKDLEYELEILKQIDAETDPKKRSELCDMSKSEKSVRRITTYKNS